MSPYSELSFWHASAGDLTPRAGLDGDTDADVAIVGGGLTGLWTAWYLLRRDPSLRVIWNVARADFLAATAKAGYNNGAGVPLTQSSVNVQLLEPGAKQLGRQNQADIRLKRTFQIGRLSLEGQADAYNAFNSGVVLSRVQTYGSRLDVPATILQGRLFRLGLQARW